MYSKIIKYFSAWICFELAYGLVFFLTHILASMVQRELGDPISRLIPYFSACISGFVGVFVGLSVISYLFASVHPRIIVLIYYAIISIILIIVLLTSLLIGTSGDTEGSWVLLQVLVSVVSAWYLTEKGSRFGKK